MTWSSPEGWFIMYWESTKPHYSIWKPAPLKGSVSTHDRVGQSVTLEGAIALAEKEISGA